ncbi:MAG: GAP family protein [Spirochaetales bacterium]
MLDLTLFVSGSALFDSVATTVQIIFLILLFSTEKPIRTSVGYLLGVCGAYFVCGLLGLAFVGNLNDLVRLFVPNLDRLTDTTYYQTQGLLGLVLLVAGPIYWLYRSRSKRPPLNNALILLAKRLNFGGALAFGAVLSATSFPAALPYVAAIEKIAAAGLAWPLGAAFVALYNLMYAVPLLVPFGLFVVLRESVLPQLHLHTQRLNVLITIVMLSGMGALLLADSGLWLATGKALMATKFL